MKLEKPKVVLNRCAAFSLIELMAVIFIIALLAAIGVALFSSATGAKYDAKIRSEMAQILLAIDGYKEKNGYYPPDNPANPQENFLFKNLMKPAFEKDLFPNIKSSQHSGEHLLVPAPNPDDVKSPNYWRYSSTKPMNNTSGFDLWAEYEGSKGPITIGNWKH